MYLLDFDSMGDVVTNDPRAQLRKSRFTTLLIKLDM